MSPCDRLSSICWHFMAYPYLPPDFDEKYDSGWVTVPNSLWDRERTDGLYQEYIDQLVYAEELGFDGLVLNEHHQNIYGLMPSPNIIAAALTQRTKRAKIVVLGNLLPLHLNPLRIAEEYAMIDSMSGGRLIAGFAMGGGPEAFNYNIPQPQARARYWEAIDLIQRAWTEDGPFRHEGPHYPLRYVNVWPQAAPAAASADLDPGRAVARDDGGRGQARLRLFPVLAHARRRHAARGAALRRHHQAAWRHLSIRSAWASCCRSMSPRPTSRRARRRARACGTSSNSASRAICGARAGR